MWGVEFGASVGGWGSVIGGSGFQRQLQPHFLNFKARNTLKAQPFQNMNFKTFVNGSFQKNGGGRPYVDPILIMGPPRRDPWFLSTSKP